MLVLMWQGFRKGYFDGGPACMGSFMNLLLVREGFSKSCVMGSSIFKRSFKELV